MVVTRSKKNLVLNLEKSSGSTGQPSRVEFVEINKKNPGTPVDGSETGSIRDCVNEEPKRTDTFANEISQKEQFRENSESQYLEISQKEINFNYSLENSTNLLFESQRDSNDKFLDSQNSKKNIENLLNSPVIVPLSKRNKRNKKVINNSKIIDSPISPSTNSLIINDEATIQTIRNSQIATTSKNANLFFNMQDMTQNTNADTPENMNNEIFFKCTICSENHFKSIKYLYQHLQYKHKDSEIIKNQTYQSFKTQFADPKKKYYQHNHHHNPNTADLRQKKYHLHNPESLIC